jgi:hypothetical protein
MRFNLACAAALAGAAVALPGWFDNDQDVVAFDDDKKVPGKNPLTYCDANHPDDIVEITNVDLLPNPPEAYVPPFYLFYSYD